VSGVTLARSNVEALTRFTLHASPIVQSAVFILGGEQPLVVTAASELRDKICVVCEDLPL
jgi:hypothetical protein